MRAKRRLTPRCTASAVGDCRPSSGMTSGMCSSRLTHAIRRAGSLPGRPDTMGTNRDRHAVTIRCLTALWHVQALDGKNIRA